MNSFLNSLSKQFLQYFQQPEGARKTYSQNIEKNLILFVFLILLGVLILSTSITSDGVTKLKNHTDSCWEKCVSFKDF